MSSPSNTQVFFSVENPDYGVRNELSFLIMSYPSSYFRASFSESQIWAFWWQFSFLYIKSLAYTSFRKSLQYFCIFNEAWDPAVSDPKRRNILSIRTFKSEKLAQNLFLFLSKSKEKSWTFLRLQWNEGMSKWVSFPLPPFTSLNFDSLLSRLHSFIHLKHMFVFKRKMKGTLKIWSF